MKNQTGYIAIASVLVIAAIVLIIGTSVLLLAVNDIQSALSNKKSDESLDLVESCVEDALLRLNEDNSIPATITLPDGSCSVTINSQVGTLWTFTVSGTFISHAKSIQVVADRTNTVTVNSWTQL